MRVEHQSRDLETDSHATVRRFMSLYVDVRLSEQGMSAEELERRPSQEDLDRHHSNP